MPKKLFYADEYVPDFGVPWPEVEPSKMDDEKMKAHVAAMQAGKWKVTPNGIGFDSRGRLIDGHHRLTASATSGFAIRCIVVRDLEPESWGAIDGGIRRDTAARAELGKLDVQNITSVRNSLMRESDTEILPETARTVNEHPFFRTASDLAESSPKTKYGSTPYRIGAAYAVHVMRRDRDWVAEQYGFLCQGDASQASQEVGRLLSDIFRGAIHCACDRERIRAFVRSAITFGRGDHPNITQALVSKTLEDVRDYFRPIFDAAGKQLSSPVA